MKSVIAITLSVALLAGPGAALCQTAQSISASDKAVGAKAHPQLLQEFGGLYGGAQASYVTRVGRRVAMQSGLAASANEFTISLLNSPLDNAFAIPGGYVYITRDLVALMNDEAELASVLGHEIGHVAARHSQKRQSAATRNSIVGALGQILVGAVAGSSGVGNLLQQGIGQGSQLLTLKFSRAQEYQADDLGIHYIAAAGYDPLAASTMLADLNAQSTLDAQTSGGDATTSPSWASTHPNTLARVRRAEAEAQKIRMQRRERGRDAFLAAIQGMVYGDDPAQGVVDGRSFKHPLLKITFSAPQGFAIANGSEAVSISGRGGQAQFLSGGSIASGGLASYISDVFVKLSDMPIDHGEVRMTRVNGLEAGYSTARASSDAGQVDVTIFAYSVGGKGYHFLTVTPAGEGLGPFQPMVESFGRLSDAQAAAIKPRRIHVVTVKTGDTAAKLAQHMAYTDLKLERFLVLNALSTDAALTPGQRVKLIVYD